MVAPSNRAPSRGRHLTWSKGRMLEWQETGSGRFGATPLRPGQGAWAHTGEMGSHGRIQRVLGVGRLSMGQCGHQLEGQAGERPGAGVLGVLGQVEFRAIRVSVTWSRAKVWVN